MDNAFNFDLLVIGAGSGGVRASRMAAAAGANVAVIEHQALGGTCVNVGCVPKKLFVYGAHYSEEFENAKGFGWSPDHPVFDWNILRDNKTREIKRLNGIYSTLLANAGVTVIQGKGTLKDAHTVCVNNKNYTAKNILLTPGSKAFIPDIFGAHYAITSDDAFYIKELPKKIIIVGGGYIAVEFASIFNGLGVNTTLSYRRDLFLRGFDLDIRQKMKDEIQKKGFNCRFNSTISQIEKKGNGLLKITWDNGETAEADDVMYATGRVPNIHSLSLENANIATSSMNATKPTFPLFTR